MADADDDAPDADDPPPPVGAADVPADIATPRFQPKAVNVGGESIVDRVLPHLKKVMVVIGVVSLILLVVFGRRWWLERGMTKSTDQVAAVLAAGDHPIRAKGDTADPKVVSFADPAERANAVLTAIAQQGIDPGPLYRASMLLDAGKLDDAIAEYGKLAADKGIDGVLAHEGKGLALEAKAAASKADATAAQKGYEAALAEFVAMQPDEAGPRYAYAQYHQGRMLILLGKQADAKTALTKAKTAAKSSADQLPELIEKRLASLGA